jgi:hypothetical protein
MNYRHSICSVLAAAVLLLLLGPAQAAEDHARFLEVLREKGYGDTALDYLKLLEQQEKLPEEIKQTLDLEKSDCYRVAAKHAYSPEQAQKLLGLAKEHLEKFVKLHPNHPAGTHALLAQADSDLEGALQKLALAKQATGAEKTTAMNGAREALLACRTRYATVRAQFSKFIAEYAKAPLPNRKLTPPELLVKNERERTEVGFVESMLKEGMINYQVGTTYADLKSADRKKAFQEAIKIFDDCFRKYTPKSDIGLQANFLKAKTLQELGDLLTAIDIFDEILVLEPPGKPSDATANFYASVALERIKLIRQQGKADVARAELEIWLKEHETWAKLPSYQGFALEKVKQLIAEAEKNPEGKTKTLQLAQTMITGIIKVESEFKNEAILLRRQLAPGEEKPPANFDEALALAENYASAESWEQAKTAFEAAIKLGTAKDGKKVDEAKQRLKEIQLQLAWKNYQAEKLDVSMAIARELMTLDKTDPVSAHAAGLAITIAHQQWDKDRKNPELLKTLTEIANVVIEKWPNRVEADEARVILGQQHLQAGDYRKARESLIGVSKDSKRYAPTQYLIGQMHWKTYFDDKKKQGNDFDITAPAQQRDIAITHFVTAVAAYDAKQASDQPLEEESLEARQMLAAAFMEASKPKEACDAAKPLIEAWKKDRPEQVNLPMLRTANVAFKANLQCDNVKEAEEVITLLIELGLDTTQVNSSLIEFARAVRRESSATLEAQLAASHKGDLKALGVIDKKLAALRSIESNMMDKLTKRQNYTLGGLMYLAETLNTIGRQNDSRKFYKTILDKADSDPDFKAQAEKVLTSVRAKTIGLLTADEKYDEALKQADTLIANQPKALEPKVEKARILTAMAKKKPTVLNYNAAINEWSNIRQVLAKFPEKPPAFYEAVMSVADGLIAQSEIEKNSKQAQLAEQLLSATMRTAPKLNGPEMVQEFQRTMQRAVTTQKKFGKAL